MAKPIALVIASLGFQSVEYQDTKKALEAAQMQVVAVSDKAGSAIASDGTTTVPIEITVNKINSADYDGIFLIGGPGALEHLDNPNVVKMVQKAADKGIPYGAICISPRILAQAGLLQGVQATGWNEDNKLQEIFEANGVEFVDKPAVTDHFIVTATGPKAATAFGNAIVKVVLAYRSTL